ncbi:MAG: cytochrome bd ubiquinol oxidase subunit [Thermodesulfobacteriota bacterium]|nr:cytochrome bd ubiquinol oxidase subunit [Thermodesulfobacteriota bacterium]
MFETIWFLLWGILWAIYFMLDGFDLGLGTLMPFVSENDTDRRVVYNAMGPFWDGNEVWLITAGGVTFAAFPTAYAVMFSTLYTPLLIILFALIIRGVSFEFRGAIDSAAWRSLWDTCLFIGSVVPALLFGVAFANIFQGIPFDAKHVFQGNLFTLLNPYGILGGVLFMALFLLHGCLWLAIKSEGSLLKRAGSTAGALWVALLLVAVLFLVFTWFATPLYANYLNNPILFIIPLLAVVALLVTRVFIGKREWWKAWFASCLTIAAAVMFGVVGLYPNLYPSSLDKAYSLTAFSAASSPLTLKIMLVVALIFVPVVIAYQAWAYHTFKDKVTDEVLASEEAY